MRVTEAEYLRLRDRKTSHTPKPSKYRNVKMSIDGQMFDSKREADYWLLLRAREANGEISDLQRQVRFPLYAPRLSQVTTGANAPSVHLTVAEYVADYTYRIDGILHVVDAKGVRTSLYRLKAKWLALQQGLTIEEV